jgi:O-antigen/teichoic acid export membrane protein
MKEPFYFFSPLKWVHLCFDFAARHARQLLFIGTGYIQAGVSFLMWMVLANLLGPEQYGIVVYGMVHGGIVAVITQFGNDQSMIRNVVQSDKPARTLTWMTILRSCIGMIIVAGYGIYALFATGTDPEVRICIFCCVVVSVLTAISPKSWYDKNQRMLTHSIVAFSERIVLIVILAVILLVRHDWFCVVTVSVSMLVGRIISSSLEWRFIGDDFHPDFNEPGYFVRREFIDNWPIALAMIFNTIILRGNQMILHSMMGLAQLACYGVAMQITSAMELLLGQLVRLQQPGIAASVVSGLSPQQIRSDIIKQCTRMGIISFAALLLVSVAGVLFIRYAMRPEYIHAIPLFRILIIRTFIYGMGMILNVYMMSLHQNKQYLLITLVLGIPCVGLAVLFIHLFGEIGAPLALLTSQALITFAQWKVLIRRTALK